MFARPPRIARPVGPVPSLPSLPSLAPFAQFAQAPRKTAPPPPSLPDAARFPALPPDAGIGFAEAQTAFLPAPAPPGPLRAGFPPPRPAQPPRDPTALIDLPLPVDPLRDPPDPHLLRRFGPALALRHGLLPWRVRGGATVILTASPASFQRHAAFLGRLYGASLRPLPCPRPLIEAALLAHAGPGLVQAAEQRAPAIASCRTLDRVGLTLAAILLAR